MRSKHIEMSRDEFEVMPRDPGWKYEYWDGTAHITPNHKIVVATLEVSRRGVNTAAIIRKAEPEDQQLLKQPFMEAFAKAVDYCDRDDDDGLSRGATQDLSKIFEHQSNKLFCASRVALDPADGSIIGAVLVTEGPVNPLLSILFVVPRWQRKGIASALVSSAVNHLHELGEKRFTTAYLQANHASRMWHRAFGFAEEPDLSLAQNYLHLARHELWRRQELGDLTAPEAEVLAEECRRLELEIDRLNELERREGHDAAHAVLRFL